MLVVHGVNTIACMVFGKNNIRIDEDVENLICRGHWGVFRDFSRNDGDSNNKLNNIISFKIRIGILYRYE